MDRLKILKYLRTTIGCIRILCLLISLLAVITFLTWKEIPDSILAQADHFASRRVDQQESSFQHARKALESSDYPEAERVLLQLRDAMRGIHSRHASYKLRREVYIALIIVKLNTGRPEEALEILNEWDEQSPRDYERDLLRVRTLERSK
jgi:thioredoxin-like negative regulator of GroEL